MKAICFDRTYDVAMLQQELGFCMQKKWVDHFNQRDYSGKWDCIALRSTDGRAETIVGIAGSVVYQDTPLLQSLPYIQKLINDIPGAKESVRLMALHPGSEIKPHRDMGCAYDEGYYRIHVPIHTHQDVEFYLEEERIDMQEGECWYLDFSKTHAVVNRSNIVRVHLVIDGIRDLDTDCWFTQHGYVEPPKPEHTLETKLAMIACLEEMNTEGARELLNQLKRELQDA